MVWRCSPSKQSNTNSLVEDIKDVVRGSARGAGREIDGPGGAARRGPADARMKAEADASCAVIEVLHAGVTASSPLMRQRRR